MEKTNDVKPNPPETPSPRRKRTVSGTAIATVLLILAAYAYVLVRVLLADGYPIKETIINFSMIFVSILMQAFPFMLIGLLISSAMHVFIPNEAIIRLFPAKHGLGFVTALFAGIFLPVCECAIVPVTTGLVKKGVPFPIAVTFMLAAPIINPVVIVSTLYAFPGNPFVAVMRVGFGLFIALTVGAILFLYQKFKPDAFSVRSVYKASKIRVKNRSHSPEQSPARGNSCSCCSDGQEHIRAGAKTEAPVVSKLEKLFIHAGNEFFSAGKYLIIGAFVTSVIQLAVPESVFTSLGGSAVVSIAVMMLMAFLFSACSTSDAFIAKSYYPRLSLSGIMGFIVYGPMMDIKNILMLLSNYNKRFVLRLSLLITAANFLLLAVFAAIFL